MNLYTLKFEKFLLKEIEFWDWWYNLANLPKYENREIDFVLSVLDKYESYSFKEDIFKYIEKLKTEWIINSKLEFTQNGLFYIEEKRRRWYKKIISYIINLILPYRVLIDFFSLILLIIDFIKYINSI